MWDSTFIDCCREHHSCPCGCRLSVL